MRARDLLYRFGLLWRGSGYWHWRYYGWDYRAKRDGDGWQVQVLGHSYRFGTLHAWRPGAPTLNILLSGPSVSRISDASGLCQQPIIAVNGSYRFLSERGLNADLYVVVDVGYVRRQWPAFVTGVRAARALAIDHRVALEVVRRDPDLLRGVDVRLFDNLQRPFGRSSHWWKGALPSSVFRDGRRAAFSMSAEAGYFPSCTVAYVALQIAATQRPARIVMFGLDLNDDGRFYREGQNEKSMIVDDYERAILPDFRFASGILRDAGVEVINASPASRLPDDVFPRCDADAARATAGQPPFVQSSVLG